MTTPSSGLRDPSSPAPPYPRLTPAVHEGPEPFDAITELFLGGEESAGGAVPALGTPALAASPHPRRRAAPIVEGIVLGHLPVFAGAWVGEYARHVAAAASEPVALLRLDGDEMRLDLYGEPEAAPAAAASPVEAIRAAAAVCSRWIVRVGSADEPRLTRLSRVNRVTVLSGADDTAIVSAYRTLKELAASSEPDAREMGVALMGAPPARAAEIEDKLLAVSRTFLGAPIRVLASVERISAGAATTLFRGTTTLSAETLLEAIDSPGAGPTACEPRPIPSAPRATEACPPVSLTPSLAGLVGGLRLTPVRCPFAPAVELAADARGRIHLLADAASDAGATVSLLLGAGAWARENHSVLGLACPGLDPRFAEPVLHLFTDQPAAMRRLLDGFFRVHLLRWVEARGERVPVCIDLN